MTVFPKVCTKSCVMQRRSQGEPEPDQKVVTNAIAAAAELPKRDIDLEYEAMQASHIIASVK